MSPKSPPPLSGSASGPVLAIILISYVMIVLDISVVLTGLPMIRDDLGFSEISLAWVQSAYTLTFGGFLLLGARAGDILGRRRMFIAGLALFTAASLAIGASITAGWMLTWRAIQGIGAAVLAPSTLSLLQTNFPEGSERTRAVSWYSAAAGISATVGLILGGVLAEWVSWRAGFYVNLPIGIGLILATRRHIAEVPAQKGAFDLLGALASTAGMGGLVYGFIRSAQFGWHDPITQATVAAGLLCLAAFIAIESRAQQPILPLWLFASAQRSGAYAGRVLYLAAMVGFFFFTTIYLQEVAGYSPALAGLAFLPATILHFPLALAVPRLTLRFGPERLLAVGIPIGMVGMVLLSRASPDQGYVVSLALPMLLIGISQGLTLSPMTSAGVAGVDAHNAGAASGAVNAAHQLGSSVGLSILVAISAIGAGSLVGIAATAARISKAYEAGSLSMLLCFAIVVFTIVRPGLRLRRGEATPAPGAR